MEELKKAVFLEMHGIYQRYMKKASEKEKAYKEMGLAYIKFAKDYPKNILKPFL